MHNFTLNKKFYTNKTFVKNLIISIMKTFNLDILYSKSSDGNLQKCFGCLLTMYDTHPHVQKTYINGKR